MSSRLDDVLVGLGDEVAALLLESPAQVRRRGSARRHHRVVGAVAAVGVVAAVAVGTAVTGAVPLPTTGRGGSSAGVQATAPEPTGCDAGPADIKGSPGARPIRGRYAVVFLANDATPAQIAAVGNVLRSSPVVESFHFEDRAAAYERFKQIYVCAPDLIEATKADSLPESFRVTLRSLAVFLPFADVLEHMPGVDSVVSNSRPA